MRRRSSPPNTRVIIVRKSLRKLMISRSIFAGTMKPWNFGQPKIPQSQVTARASSTYVNFAIDVSDISWPQFQLNSNGPISHYSFSHFAAFSHLHQLKVHTKMHAKLPENHLQCRICKKKFKKKLYLKDHVLRHKGIKNFECPVCERRFVSRNELRKHIVSPPTISLNHI